MCTGFIEMNSQTQLAYIKSTCRVLFTSAWGRILVCPSLSGTRSRTTFVPKWWCVPKIGHGAGFRITSSEGLWFAYPGLALWQLFHFRTSAMTSPNLVCPSQSALTSWRTWKLINSLPMVVAIIAFALAREQFPPGFMLFKCHPSCVADDCWALDEPAPPASEGLVMLASRESAWWYTFSG